MRPLTDQELEMVIGKLSNYIGDNVQHLFERSDGRYCLRLHKDRVYYASESLMRRSTVFSRKHLVCFGNCLGKLTHSGKFRVQITALDYLAPYAQHKIYLKPQAEQQFLYGHNITKSGVARVPDSMPRYSGVVLCSMQDLPLGFGVAAKSTQECRHADPLVTAVFHQADLGEYVRAEDSLSA